jgi:hypothetical protein
MWRVVLEPLVFFLAPFVVYGLFIGFRRRHPLALDHWSGGAVSTLTLIGLASALIGMLGLGLFAERHTGAYVPAHIEKGKLVPGRMQ